MSFLIVASAVLVASTLQAATGFGFALVAAPVFFAVLSPPTAVALVLIVSQAVNLLVLFGERRRPRIEWSAVLVALYAALPGLIVGAVIVRAISPRELQIVVGAAVCMIGSLNLVGLRHSSSGARPTRAFAVAAGFAAGVLTTSTGTNGPPLGLWLASRRMPAAAIRDVASVMFVGLDAAGLTVLVTVVGARPLVTYAAWIPILLPIVVVGHLLGRRIFARLPTVLFEPIVLGVAFVAGLSTLISGIRG